MLYIHYIYIYIYIYTIYIAVFFCWCGIVGRIHHYQSEFGSAIVRVVVLWLVERFQDGPGFHTLPSQKGGTEGRRWSWFYNDVNKSADGCLRERWNGVGKNWKMPTCSDESVVICGNESQTTFSQFLQSPTRLAFPVFPPVEPFQLHLFRLPSGNLT